MKFRRDWVIVCGALLASALVDASAEPSLPARFRPYVGGPLAAFVRDFGEPMLAAGERVWHWDVAWPVAGGRGLPSPTVDVGPRGEPRVSGGAGMYAPPSFRALPCDITAAVDEAGLIQALRIRGVGCQYLPGPGPTP